ncbi:hypothetical protein ASH02_23040 [Nocardioides sp. Soil796]|nr:hypothetical protein ASH02_23040 [Nocardioides sp. Soil796]
MVTDPRLLVYAHERFEQLGSQGIEHIIAREGQEFDPVKARLLVRLVVAVFDTCLDSLADWTEGTEVRPVVEIFDEVAGATRDLVT